MKWGGFIVNGRPYQFFSKEHTFVNRLLEGNGGITRRGGVWNFLQSNNEGNLWRINKGGSERRTEAKRKAAYGGTFPTKPSEGT